MTLIASDKFTADETNHLARIKNIVMVASAKGGVGKSTTTVNLALAMAATGARVGLLDADIYGPSQQAMLGISKNVKPVIIDDTYMEPVESLGIKAMSIGFLAKENTPMVWRGPMAVKALQQLLEQTLWGELDYLFIDMPPGTGDIHISLAQKVSVSAAIVVTTPQEVALIDARKGIEMFTKVNTPVLGIIENMSTYSCCNCGHQNALFGEGGAKQLQEEYGTPLLASMPLDPEIGKDVDRGCPTVVAQPDSEVATKYIALAAQVAAKLLRLRKPEAARPTIQFVD